MMKKILTLSLSLLASFPLLSQDSIQCEIKSLTSDDKIKITVQRKQEQTVLSVDKEQFRVTKVLESKISNIDELYACSLLADDGNKKCQSQYFGEDFKDQYKTYLPREVSVLYGLSHYASEEDPSEEPFSFNYSFDLAQVAFARKYLISDITKFGAEGLTEYFDMKGNLLGRIFSPNFMTECL